MSLSFSKALRILDRTYRNYPLRRRAHILGRFLTCPFLRVLDHLPAGASLLEIGAGDGIFMRLAIETGERSRVIGVEPDLRKSLRAWKRHPAHFVAGYAESVRGVFDAVAMLDVLYRVPGDAWPQLFTSIRERVAPGGLFLLKELDPQQGWKSGWNRTQEWISDRFLNLTLGHGMHYRTVVEVSRLLKDAGFDSVDLVKLDRGYPHAHVLWVARTASTSPEARVANA